MPNNIQTKRRRKMRTIEISDETYDKIKDQLTNDDLELEELSDLIGKKFLFRLVTYHIVGKVQKQIKGTRILILSNASWVADSGRFMQAIRDGILNEVEPVGPALINLDAMVDAFPWNHDLPKEQK